MNNKHKDAMRHHIAQIYRETKPEGAVYRYIMTRDDLWEAYQESQRDLSYTLRKEVKRDRFVLNSDGMRQIEQGLIEMLNNEMARVAQEMLIMLQQDSQQVLNNLQIQITKDGVMTFNSSGSSNVSNSFGARLGAMLGKAIVKSVSKVLEDVTGYK